MFLVNNGHRAIKVHKVQYCRVGHLFYSVLMFAVHTCKIMRQSSQKKFANSWRLKKCPRRLPHYLVKCLLIIKMRYKPRRGSRFIPRHYQVIRLLTDPHSHHQDVSIPGGGALCGTDWVPPGFLQGPREVLMTLVNCERKFGLRTQKGPNGYYSFLFYPSLVS